MNQKDNKNIILYLSALTVIITILAIMLYIYYGNSWEFYLTVIFGICIGMINAWIIEKSDSEINIVTKQKQSIAKGINKSKAKVRKPRKR
ncbi:MAG: hypothetical protein ACP5RP_02325 [Candidatus Micrarchaeia archaeon]